ncbi:MAG: fibronectin type III domain-containing protein, partial [Deltaproteobacteria bacterium]|nr:fibronectin type III domain-containing protein [Deltaproteobacteria bacterium]
ASTLDNETTNQIRIKITNTTTNAEYAISVSSINQSGVTYEQGDGTIGATAVWKKIGGTGWDETGNALKGLMPNTSYYVWVKARNYAEAETDFGASAVRWTKMRNAASISVIGITSGTLTADVLSDRGDGDFEHLGEGGSHIRISTATSGFPDSIYHSLTSTSVYEFTELTPNTSYTIKAKAYNGAGVFSNNEPQDTVATRIELSTAVVFGVVLENSIEAKTGSVFTGIDKGGSGWSVYCNKQAEDSGYISDPTMATYYTFSGLDADTTYWFKTRSRNRAGLVNEWSGLFKKSTLAKAVSGAPSLTVNGTDEINIAFTDPGNQPETRYRIAVSSNDWVTTSYVKATGLLGGATVWQTRADWEGGTGGQNVTGLSANVLYKFRVMAKNSQEITTLDSPAAEKYTKIESPTGLSFDIYTSSMKVMAAGTISNLSEGSSGIYFRNEDTGQISNNPNGWQTQIYWVNSSLTANTTYSWVVKTRNGDGVDNGFIVAQITSTRIEEVTGCDFSGVSAGKIDVKPANVDSLTNLSVGDSGWQIGVDANEGSSPETYSDWKQDSTVISTTTLMPDHKYRFWGRSRNSYGKVTPWSDYADKYTHAKIPSTATVTAVSATSLRIVVSTTAENGNPSVTTYRIELKDNTGDPAWEEGVTKYVTGEGNSNLTFSTAPADAQWRTRSGWNGDTGITVAGLDVNTQYMVRLCAKNQEEVLAGPSSCEAVRTTLSSVPEFTAVEPDGADGVSRINMAWGDAGASYYQVDSATSSLGAWTLLMDWTNTLSTAHYSLSPDTHTYYRVRGKNGASEISDWSTALGTYTWAAEPGAGTLTNPTTYSLKLDWAENGNPGTVEYYAEVSDSSTTWTSPAGDTGWVSLSSAVVTGISANTKYYFRVKAKNSVGIDTAWKEHGTETGKYTEIEDASGVEWVNIGTSSITVQGGEPITNLSSQYESSAIDFRNLRTGTSTQWIQTNQWANTGLSANTTYAYEIRTRNGDGIANDWIAAVTTATRIETVSSLQFTVWSSSIGIAALADGGSFSNLTAVDSGIEYYVVTGSTGSLWRQTTNYWWFDNWGAGLTAAKTYTFKAKSRNRNSYENDYSGEFSTATLANEPGSGNPTAISSDTITANWTANGNESAEYELRWSTAADYSVYDSSSGISGQECPSYNLTPNTTYYFKVRAFNPDGVGTDFTGLPAQITKMEEPGSMTFAVNKDSITVTATGSYTNIDSGDSGICIWNTTLTPDTSSQWQKTMVWASTSLDHAKNYTFKLRARNQLAQETGYIELTTATLAVEPGVNELANISTCAIKAQWTSNDNISPEYFVEVSTKSFGGLVLDTYGWGTALSNLFEGLEANRKHYFRVKARNPDGVETGYTDLASSYTKVESPTGLSFTANTTSITVTALGTISNLENNGVSGINFELDITDNFTSPISSS